MLDVIPSGSTFVQSPQKRDSLLIADQVEYGFTLKDFPGGSTLALEELPPFLKTVSYWCAPGR